MESNGIIWNHMESNGIQLESQLYSVKRESKRFNNIKTDVNKLFNETILSVKINVNINIVRK